MRAVRRLTVQNLAVRTMRPKVAASAAAISGSRARWISSATSSPRVAAIHAMLAASAARYTPRATEAVRLGLVAAGVWSVSGCGQLVEGGVVGGQAGP